MTIEIKNDHVLVTHKNKKVLLDGCGKPNELKSYLEVTKLMQAGAGKVMNIPLNMPKGTAGIKLIDFLKQNTKTFQWYWIKGESDEIRS